MQLKQFYDIATKVSSRKSATTFGDLPDCLWNHSHRKTLFATNAWLFIDGSVVYFEITITNNYSIW